MEFKPNRLIYVMAENMGLGAGSAEKPASQGEKPKAPEALTPAELDKQKRDLQSYIDERANFSKDKPALDKFKTSLDDWDKKGDVESLRLAGNNNLTEQQFLKQYRERSAKLSSAFLEQDPQKPNAYAVNFHGNTTAEWKVGMGDMFPPEVSRIYIERADGSTVTAVRGWSVERHRIGYFDEKGINAKPPIYDYGFVHTGDKVSILETKPNNDQALKAEYEQLYKLGGAKDSASMPPEIPPSQRREYTAPILGMTQAELANLGRTVRQPETKVSGLASVPKYEGRMPTVGTKKIEGKDYQAIDRSFWNTVVGNNPKSADRYIAHSLDPVSHEQLTFLGAPIPDGVNILVLPYLREAEARCKAAGVDFRAQKTTSTAWRPVRESTSQSYHSWGAAIDVDYDVNQFKKPWEQCDPNKRIPMQVVEIMENLGFTWGGRWKGRPDPMHFELSINPYTSTDLLTTTEGKRYADALLLQHSETGTPSTNTRPEAIAQTMPESGRRAPEGSKEAPYNAIIDAAAEKYSLPVALVKAIIEQESNYTSDIANNVNCGGLMAISGVLAKQYGLNTLPRISNSKYFTRLALDPNDDRADPVKNVDAGCRFLRTLLDKYGRYPDGEVLAFAAYNSGPGRIDNWLKSGRTTALPAETQNYMKKVPERIAKYEKASADTRAA